MDAAHSNLILAVETCSGQSSIALARGAGDRFELIGQVELAAEWTSTALHVEITGLLTRHQLTTAEIAAYAVTNGPGSFTAVRVGATAVKGLAEVHGKPVVAVSTLALIAQGAIWSAAESDPAATTRRDAVWIPILDARRAQVFSGFYRIAAGEDGSLELQEPETVSALSVVLERCRGFGDVPLHFCSPNLTAFRETIATADLAPKTMVRQTLISVPTALAGALARMALRSLARGGGIAAIAVDANYVRASDAELFWKG